jgi:Fe-S cluster assembly protein SufD
VIEGFVERFARISRNGGAIAPDWLTPVRNAALERFVQLGLPTTKNEDWHFTSVQPIANAELTIAEPQTGAITRDDVLRLQSGARDWPQIVMVNGVFSAELSSIGTLPAGVTITPMTDVLRERRALPAEFLARVADYQRHTFTALNTAFLREGVYIHASAGSESATPVRILHIADRNATGQVLNPRHLILADANTRLTVVESYAGAAGVQYFTNAVTEIVSREGASVSHFRLQREGTNAFHVGTVEAQQARDSHFISFSFASGARLSRMNIYTLLDGPGCGATLNGLYMVDGQQHVDHQTRIEHAQPNCYSREVYKGILDGESHGVFNGKVYVHPVAQKTDGKQSNNNLLLSEKAHVDTKPQLEIFADDVKCTHGATVGRIDEVALFYMKSRGLNARMARDLLTYAFAAEVLEQIGLEELRDELEALTMNRFTTH